MKRVFGFFLLVLVLSAGAAAALNPGTISGYVRDSSGVAQMGATVEIIGAASSLSATTYTDSRGYYSVRGLLPGSYTVRVSAPSFLPTIQEKIGLQSGANLVLNLTLKTLFQAMQLVPARSHGTQDEDDWRWTLRSMANRPILRLQEDGTVAVVQEGGDKQYRATVAFMAGSSGEAFAGSDMSTVFSYEQSLFGSGKLRFTSDIGHGPGLPVAVIRAGYQHELPNGGGPQVFFTARRFSTPEMNALGTNLQALSLAAQNTSVFGDRLELTYGGEMQAIQMLGTETMAYRPYGSADFHFGRNTVLEYRLATSLPNMRYAKGFDSAPADLSESGPRISLLNGLPEIERAHHHEISLSQRFGRNNFQVAVFSDRISNIALTGVGSNLALGMNVMPDVYSGTFLMNGGTLESNGIRAVYQRKLPGNLSTTFDYAYGGVLTSPESLININNVRASLRAQKRHSAAVKFSGILPGSGTRVITSYRWLQGNAITPVDPFNASAGQTDPFLNVYVRQPIPAWRIIPGGIEVLVDVRNLLAEGYRPVLGPDGQTVYLVPSARSVRGGLSFTF